MKFISPVLIILTFSIILSGAKVGSLGECFLLAALVVIICELLSFIVNAFANEKREES